MPARDSAKTAKVLDTLIVGAIISGLTLSPALQQRFWEILVPETVA
jgi:L-2-hydroxyglutarate oxidase LhgO